MSDSGAGQRSGELCNTRLMVALSLESAMAWAAWLTVIIAIGRLIWWLLSRGHASPGDFFP